MTTKIIKSPPAFLHWESHPSHSREQIEVAEDVKRGDLIIKTSGGWKPYRGTSLTPDSGGGKIIVAAFVLQDTESGKKAPCIVRNAIILYDQINHAKKTDFDSGQPLADVKGWFDYAAIVIRFSVGV